MGRLYTIRQWDVSAWYGQSLDNKPFIAVDQNGYVYTTDPESGGCCNLIRMANFCVGGQS